MHSKLMTANAIHSWALHHGLVGISSILTYLLLADNFRNIQGNDFVVG